VGPLLQEFFNRFPPTRNQEGDPVANGGGAVNGEQLEAAGNDENKNGDQPVEKKKKI
jgi:hypothetical protein